MILFVLYSEIFEILLLFGIRNLVVLTGLWKVACFKDSDACHTYVNLVDGCFDNKVLAVLGGKQTSRVQGLRRKIFFFSCFPLSEGGGMYLLGNTEFSHFCTDRWGESLWSLVTAHD